MKARGIGSRLSLLIAVLLISYYLGQPLYWDMQSRLQRIIVPFDDPTELTSSRPDSGQNGNFSSSVEDAQQGNQQTANVFTKGAVEKSGSSADAFGKEQHSAAFNFSSEAGSFSPIERARPLHDDLQRKIWEVPPVGSVMPPLEEFALRREIVDFRAKKNIIAVTFANYAFLGFVLTWVKSLTDGGVNNLLVGAMDTQLLEALYWAGIPTFDMGSNMKTIDVGWGSPTFHKMGREKVILVNAFLALEFELLMCDTDVVWLMDPFPFIERYREADVLTSSDEVVNSVDDESLETWQLSYGAYNIGINHWRPTAAAKKFAAEWMAQLLSDDQIWDQNGFNELMRRTLGPNVDNSSGLFYSYDGGLKLGILPALYKELGLQPYAIHTTFQFAGTEGKRHRLREAKVFYDSPDYYDVPVYQPGPNWHQSSYRNATVVYFCGYYSFHSLVQCPYEGGYLSYTPSLPENLMTGGAHTVESHFNLVNHQLVQVRSAMAIASTLNRTLVMPELWCRFDRMWFGHPGILQGTHTKQPFLCPMDHIFEVNMLLKDLPDEHFGPAIRFREYSFLDNPRLPRKVKESTLKVNLCELGTPGCNREPSKAMVSGTLQLPLNSTEDQLKASLSSYTEAQVIEFSSMLGAFGSFSDEVRAALFANRVKSYTGIWCCVQDRIPGHIWYDIYWDRKPEWKPKPPGTPEDDHRPL